MWITSSFDTIRTPTLVALGNFDGVHQGHKRVIEPILPSYQSGWVGHPFGVADSGAARSAYPTVVTFYPHPQEFFTGQKRLLLTPLDEKVLHLRQMGVEQLVLLPFDHTLASMSPQSFVDIILVKHLQTKCISVGRDFCFGQKRSGTTDDLQAIATPYGINVQVVPLHTLDGERISSSAIRHGLQQGNLTYANHLLGRPYSLVGKVVEGRQLGRTLGFPTANLQLSPEKFLPRQGVYAVEVQGSTLNAQEQRVPGVMNIGTRPTVDGVKQTIEVHLLDWSGDLYGQTLIVHLQTFIRPEQKFSSLEALKAQIQTDCATARSLSTITPSV